MDSGEEGHGPKEGMEDIRRGPPEKKIVGHPEQGREVRGP